MLKTGGWFLYTDLLPVQRWMEVRALLAPLGFTLDDDRDITANVLASCDEVAATRAQAFGGAERRHRQLPGRARLGGVRADAHGGLGVPHPPRRAIVTPAPVSVHVVPVVPGPRKTHCCSIGSASAEREAIGVLGFAADRDRAVTARAAARLEVGRRLGVHPRVVPLLTGMIAGGRPSVAGANIGISWAHSGAWVALALTNGHPVGVDIEAMPERIPFKALERIGLSSIHDFVAREAAGKVWGQGLAGSWPLDVSVRPFRAPIGYLGAVAAPGSDWTVELQSLESRNPPASVSATAPGVWDTTGAGSRRVVRSD